MKIKFKKEIDFSASNIYKIIEDWLSSNDIKANVISHEKTNQLADDIFNELIIKLNQ